MNSTFVSYLSGQIIATSHEWWFSKGNLLISGKSSWMKYYDLARFIVSFFPLFVETATQGVHRIPCDIRSVRFKQLCGGTSREFQTSMESRMSFHVPWLLGQVKWCFVFLSEMVFDVFTDQ